MATTSGNAETGVDAPDLVLQDRNMGKNVCYAGSRMPGLPSDDSPRPNQRAQHVVPSNSLLWKYMADPFATSINRSRAICRNGRKYRTINAETYYWAHVTFFAAIYRASDLGVLARSLSREEKAQIFEESKEWFSLYGVDDRGQPQTYDEFKVYLKDVVGNRLVDSTLAQYTVGFARKILPLNAFPKKYRPLARPLLPLLRTPLRWITVPVLEPQIRDILGLDWSEKEERRFRRYVKSLRFIRLAMMRLHVPLRFRYRPYAIEAFQREGINPDDITLESARAALAEHRVS
ncbi:Uncharacterized protein conserved in bacteria [Mycobacteroides abscessus subsp. massiliense]|uniref:oxygenase MpaB family protein n=1 Tax=Mycobacteroides abscessus TaxID=36809 RepID=UPI0009C8D666|nr:oxygenase MpaB family protein [Mycobacteroides abscessus]SKT94587.1 Uncharacterized protein conserved in bacteria [Mycobacteroides abscessus subsp. massiliense]